MARCVTGSEKPKYSGPAGHVCMAATGAAHVSCAVPLLHVDGARQQVGEDLLSIWGTCKQSIVVLVLCNEWNVSQSTYVHTRYTTLSTVYGIPVYVLLRTVQVPLHEIVCTVCHSNCKHARTRDAHAGVACDAHVGPGAGGALTRERGAGHVVHHLTSYGPSCM